MEENNTGTNTDEVIVLLSSSSDDDNEQPPYITDIQPYNKNEEDEQDEEDEENCNMTNELQIYTDNEYDEEDNEEGIHAIKRQRSNSSPPISIESISDIDINNSFALLLRNELDKTQVCSVFADK